MFSQKQNVLWLAASVALCFSLATAALAAPPEGKGKGNGGGDDLPELPEGLEVRYRVQFLPVPENIAYVSHRHLNDSYETVGRWAVIVDGERITTGFYYNALTREYLNADDMITLPERWIETAFRDINNHGTIVGYAVDVNGIYKGIVIYPEDDGYAYEFLPSPVPSAAEDAYEYIATGINDWDDIVGTFWNADGGPYSPSEADAFAYNPGLLPMTPFGLPDTYDASITVTNARRGIAESDSVRYWFDFADAETLYDGDPDNDVDPVFPVVIPADWTHVSNKSALSHDSQLAVYRREVIGKKGRTEIYGYRPGVILNGELIWQGEVDDVRPQAVNSAPAGSDVGDILGGDWLKHHFWGYLNLRSMLVFDSTADERFWDESDPTALNMSDRDLGTGFGVIIGEASNDEAFVLMPEIVAP